MKLFSQLFLALTILLTLGWQLPWCYAFLHTQSSKHPFTLYSYLIDDFLSMGYSEGNGVIRRDQTGNCYTQEQTDSLLPMFYVRQLMADGRFPDSIQGTPVTPREIQRSNFNFRVTASDINRPIIPLYPLLESMSGRIDLQMPDDVFRITSQGIEFVTMENNTVNTEKSKLFTETMKKKGFVFPNKYIAGNPTTQKEYDEGYLILDATGQLYHLKQTKGRPFVRFIQLPANMKLQYLFITEFSDRKTLGYLVDENHRFYILNTENYEIISTQIDNYNPETDNLTIFGNRFDWTICISTRAYEHYYALKTADYSLIKSISFPAMSPQIPGLHFTSSQDKYVKPRIQ